MADAPPLLMPPPLKALMLLGLLAGCASRGERWWPQTATPDDRRGPAGLWGRPETEADAGLSCNGAVVTAWFAADAPLSPGRAVPISAGTATLALTERFVVDGVGTAQFDIPLASPLADAIAGGAPALRFGWPQGSGQLPLGRIPQQLVRDCRAQVR